MSWLSKTGDWLDARTGFRNIVKHALEEPVPGGARWAYIFGSVLVGCITLQAITGWAMMAYYAPSSTTAWASVEHITFGVSGGWFVRGMHHFGAHAMIVVLALHIGQVAVYGAYRAPREVNWWFGLGLLGITLGFGLTGYLLPWDQKGYWATRVATNIMGITPVLGKAIQKAAQGGAEYGSLTLTRFYTLHIAILPLLLLLLLVAHVALFRKHGVTPPAKADLSKQGTFWPEQLAKDVGGMLLLVVVVAALALKEHGAPLDAPADPSSDYPARPEWYFLSLFQLLKYFEGSWEVVGAMVIPGVAGAYLALLPLWDKSKTNALGPRLKYLAPLGAMGVGVVALTMMSMSADAKDEPFQKAREIASKRADNAIELAKKGIPPDGPLAMLRRDPETRGTALFLENCASCHRLNEMGPPKEKATAPDLTGWGTPDWAMSMLENPDAPHRFGQTPYKGEMVSVVKPPADANAAKTFKPMAEADRNLIVAFLANEAAEVKDRQHDAAGAKLVGQRCTACHTFRGQTDDDDSIGPELAGWGSLAWTRAQIANPSSNATYRKDALSEERKGHMPRFDDKLDAADLDLLAGWVRRKARGGK
ncbi:MAG TPA: cytochrome b N-terminal domain-containing protein [Polyangiaceae bacterium]|nr:cytochrome b N-terminal domain-containing protein [Polyangiaceae bacterium]